jgi:DNA-binding transcriptional regulator YiaG
MNNKELAKYLEISEQGLYKWKKSRPTLYKIVMDWKNGLNSSLVENQELNKLFNQLSTKEQEMYLSEIRARVLRKKLDS